MLDNGRVFVVKPVDGSTILVNKTFFIIEQRLLIERHIDKKFLILIDCK